MYEDLYGFGASPHDGGRAAGWATYSGEKAARATQALLGLMLLWHLALLVGRLIAPSVFGGKALAAVTALGTVGLFLATGVAFLTWFYRAYLATAAAENSVHPPSQAVWTFFVPILNLFRPYQIATEIYRKTDRDGTSAHSPLIIVWWVLWCVARVSPFGIASLMVGSLDQPGMKLLGVAEVALTASAIAVVRTLDGRIRALQGQTAAPATF